MGSIAAFCLASDKDYLRRLRKQPARGIALASLLLFMVGVAGVSQPYFCPASNAGAASVSQAMETAAESCQPEMEKEGELFPQSGILLPPDTLFAKMCRDERLVIIESRRGSPTCVRGPPTAAA